MELPGLDALRAFGRRAARAFSPRLQRWTSAGLLAAVAATLLVASPARADDVVTAAPGGTAVLVTNPSIRPKGYRLTASRVLAIALANPVVKAELRKHPLAQPYEYTHDFTTWQVSWFSHSRPQRELLQVFIDDNTGRVTQAWTGFQVAWGMARGYPGAFGRRVNAVYLWLPMCLFFLAPFLPWRRRSGGWRLTLLHLDLAVLLGFSISLALFNHGTIGLSVPLIYPPLIYLLIRMLLLAAGRGRPRRPLQLTVPTHWLLIGAVFLIGLRIGLNLLNSNVIDVGYSGVIGADKLIHGHLLYGLWPKDDSFGDTYAPFSYYAYVPFRLIFGWSGTWDTLPAAHAAAIVFDLITAGGLYLLGRRIRSHTLGVVLLYTWVAYPFTLWTLSSNTNDSLVAATVVLALLALQSPPGRGVLAALAGMTKFAPFALAPLLLRGTGRRPTERSTALFILAFAATVFLLMLPVVLHGDLDFFWNDSIRYQADRVTPLSVWGLWGGLGGLQHVLEGMAAALGLVVAFVPRRRGVVEVAALGAAVLIALQLAANYWLYSYIVWFFPLVAVALLAAHPERSSELRGPVDELDRARPQPLGSGRDQHGLEPGVLV